MDLILNDDVISYIMSLIKPNPAYFRLNKKFYEMRNHYLALHVARFNKSPKRNREITNFCLLHYYALILKDDIGSYRKYILYFMINKNRKSTIYPCTNSYHRMLVHNFCDLQKLKHETIIQGTKKVRTCKVCESPNISIKRDYYDEYHCYCNNCNYHDVGYDEYHCYCNNCNYHDVGYGAVERFVCYTSLPHKAIRITKV